MEEGDRSRVGKSALIIAFSIALGFAFDWLLFEQIPGLGFTAFITLIIAVYIGLALYQRKSLQADLLWLFPVLLFFAAMVAIRANPLLMALNIVGCALLLLLISEVSVRGSVRQFIPSDYLKLFIPPIQFLGPLFRSCADVISVRRLHGDQKKNAQIIRGIVITLPVVVLFAVLFASADPVFNKYVFGLFKFNLEEETIARFILGFAVAILLAGAYAYSFGGKPFAWGILTKANRPMGQIETSILLGSVNILFLAFIVVQISYLFGGVSNIVSDGFTYAEYARRGFFELLGIAFFSYLILLAVEKYIERDAEVHTSAFKLLSTALVLQLAVIMFSAFTRLSLYEEAFGFTTLRLYTHTFILLLGVVFSFLLYKILVENKDNTFAFRTFLAILVFVAGMNLFNPDAFIAKKNMDRYMQTGKLDVAYLNGLSADATLHIVAALDAPELNVRGGVGHELLNRLNTANRNWQSWNYARESQRVLLESRRTELEQYASYEVPAVTSSKATLD